MAIDVTQRTNGERVVDLARLGYLPEPVLDPTYGEGGMWTRYRPEQLTAHDHDAAKSPTGESIDFRDLPYPDESFATVLYDPPYRFVGTPTNVGGHDDQYGTNQARTKAEIWALIVDGAIECGRVASEYLIAKLQRQVVTDEIFDQPNTLTNILGEHGWKYGDDLHLLSYRSQPPDRPQHHSRSNYSTFTVYTR